MKIVAVMLVLAAPAAAQAFDLSAASPAALKAAMSGFSAPEPRAVAVALKSPKPAPAAPVVVIEGKPLGSDVLRYTDQERHPEEMTWIELNDAKDRVAVIHKRCLPVTGDEAQTCEDVKFLLPGLTVDLAAKRILHGETPVARIGGFWTGIRLEKGWSFRAEKRVEEGVYDDGFHRARRWRVAKLAIFLEQR